MQSIFYSYHDYHLERNLGFSKIRRAYLKPLTKVFVKENRVPFLLANSSVSCLFLLLLSFVPQHEHLAESLAGMQNGFQGAGSTFQKSMINIPWLYNSTGLIYFVARAWGINLLGSFKSHTAEINFFGGNIIHIEAG